jgi:TolB-like protein/Flp pilus assembly protein TadD
MRLGRLVALKVLPDLFFSDPSRRARFEREARLLASLNHPGIATLFSFEEVSGRHLLSMELVEGEGLDQRIAAGPLSAEEILSLSAQIAEALEAAHAAGITHRDLKPANIRIATGGTIKLLDFGLARKYEEESAGPEEETSMRGLTQQGAVIGTLPYMSPEQISGRPMDHRTDIFSLGIVLYEMATGKRPFHGRSNAELASAILRDAAPSVSELRADLPVSFVLALRHCLEKEPRNRPAAARDIFGSRVASSAHTPALRVTIAVLPFSDMSPARDQEYLCEGMAEEIMNALVGIDGIGVASRTSAFWAARQGEDLPAIARALNVGHILEGSVRTAAQRIRVTARLTDVGTGFQTWSARYDREAGDIFAVQDDIATGVVEAVRSRLAPGSRSIEARPQVRNLEAYQHYLKGRHLRYSRNDNFGAVREFEQAVSLDPVHAASWVGLAESNVFSATYGLKRSDEAYSDAKSALVTAAGLQGQSGEVHYVEGVIAVSEHRWRDAEKALLQATAIAPAHVAARCWLGVFYWLRGRIDEARTALEHARELDPLGPYPYNMAALCLLHAGKIEEANRLLEEALVLDEDNSLALWLSGLAHAAVGELDVALSRIERAHNPAQRGGFISGVLGWALAVAGRPEDARRILDNLRARPPASPTVVSESWLLASLGEIDAAFQALDAVARDRNLILLFPGLPGFDAMRSDTRFSCFVAGTEAAIG